jgi:hypothetical protein
MTVLQIMSMIARSPPGRTGHRPSTPAARQPGFQALRAT